MSVVKCTFFIVLSTALYNWERLLRILDRLVGLMVKVSASRAEDVGFESRLRWDFFRVESYQ